MLGNYLQEGFSNKLETAVAQAFAPVRVGLGVLSEPFLLGEVPALGLLHPSDQAPPVRRVWGLQ